MSECNSCYGNFINRRPGCCGSANPCPCKSCSPQPYPWPCWPDGPGGPSGPPGPPGPPGPGRPFLSSYYETLALEQSVAIGADIAFSTDSEDIDVAGRDITLDSTGRIFTIHRAGLYHVEWSLNLGTATAPVVVGLMENNAATSALSNASVTGNFSSGALLNVKAGDVPFTLRIHNFGGPLTLVDPVQFDNIAASIRILRFADGPA